MDKKASRLLSKEFFFLKKRWWIILVIGKYVLPNFHVIVNETEITDLKH